MGPEVQFTSRCEAGVLLSTVSTFGIGGPAALLFRARTVQDLQEAMEFVFASKTPYLVVGRGSNCLFPDNGFPGLVIVNRLEEIREEGAGRFIAGGGVSLPVISQRTAKDGWCGLEFASGIPGSVGGAVYMNAGASGQQTASIVESVTYIDEQGALHDLHDLSFGYRFSSLRGKGGIIASATFQLRKDEHALERQKEMAEYRKRTQPKDRSAGCVFRNPLGLSAGRLIDEAGLKGRRIGGAEVSPVHANFIVNRGGATAADVRALIDVVRSEVLARSGVSLDCEVICL